MSDFYDGGVEGLLDRSIDWLADDFRVVLLARGYRFSPVHRVFADLAAHVNGSSDSLTGKRIVGRRAFAQETYLLAQRGVYSDAVALYRHGGEMRLLLWAEAPAAQPVAGQRIDIPWPDGLVFTF